MNETMIELAPRNPYGLAISTALLPAPGCAVRDLDMRPYGAFVTRATTLHTRHDPVVRVAPVAGGLVVSAVSTISIRTLLKEETKRWERATLPVIVTVQGDASELDEMATRLENYDIAGLLVVPEGDTLAAVRAARQATLRPLLTMLPHGETMLVTAQALEAAGADALVLSAPPRAAAYTDGGWDGVLLGPAVFPLMLQALRDLGEKVDLPIILLGGIVAPDAARAALDAGASALMIDAVRWGDLLAGTRIADALQDQIAP